MNRLKFIKSFESFNLEEFNSLISYNKTYIRKNKRGEIITNNNYITCLGEIRNYDIDNFIYKYTSYGILIYPDKKFKDILVELNKTIEDQISLDIMFYITVDVKNLNQIDFTEGIPEVIRGTGLAYRLYKKMIDKFYYITSNKHSTILAYNIWYNLMIDKDLYCYTSNFYSGVISKSIDDIKMKVVLDKISKMDIIFDSELEDKIIDIYGSMDIYKQ